LGSLFCFPATAPENPVSTAIGELSDGPETRSIQAVFARIADLIFFQSTGERQAD